MISPLIGRLIDLALEEDLVPEISPPRRSYPRSCRGKPISGPRPIWWWRGLRWRPGFFVGWTGSSSSGGSRRRPGSGKRHGPGPPYRPRGLDPYRRTGGPRFFQRLSGIATFTRAMAAQVAGSPAVLVDTRKTTPGWRVLEKYAVRLGGGRNHRLGLYDGVLIKNNHLTAGGNCARPWGGRSQGTPFA